MQVSETRKFSVSPNIIFALIKAQAGSLGKAITECVMNSVDAFASRVAIRVTPTTVTITDDGRGFQSREEIEAWFETLGFDHTTDDNHRAFGAFGIGRAQLWSFASTVWRTHSFVMDVDIKHKGLDYKLNHLVDGAPVPGLVIEGQFYKPLDQAELIRLEQDLRRLVRYVSVPVTLNGMNLCTDPATLQWDLETEDAWFSFDKQHTTGLEVFNMGVLVSIYGHYHYKVSGRVVTKPNVKLALNMARNDVLTAECKVWERIAKVLQENVVEPAAKKPAKAARLTNDDIAARVRKVLDLGSFTEDAFVDVRGRNRSLLNIARATNRVCFADPSNEKAKRAHQLKLAVVLKPETLTRFGCTSASELQDKLAVARSGSKWCKEMLEALTFFDTLEDALPTLDDRYETLANQELPAIEQVLLHSLTRTRNRIRQDMVDLQGKKIAYGSVRAGRSDVAKGWCVSSDIMLERSVLKQAARGLPGFIAATGYIVHEMVAGLVDSNTEHAHTPAFYEHLQALLLDPKVIQRILAGYAQFTRECANRGIHLSAGVLKDLTAVAEAEAA